MPIEAVAVVGAAGEEHLESGAGVEMSPGGRGGEVDHSRDASQRAAAE
jgi:hypothetical protein